MLGATCHMGAEVLVLFRKVNIRYTWRRCNVSYPLVYSRKLFTKEVYLSVLLKVYILGTYFSGIQL